MSSSRRSCIFILCIVYSNDRAGFGAYVYQVILTQMNSHIATIYKCGYGWGPPDSIASDSEQGLRLSPLQHFVGSGLCPPSNIFRDTGWGDLLNLARFE